MRLSTIIFGIPFYFQNAGVKVMTDALVFKHVEPFRPCKYFILIKVENLFHRSLLLHLFIASIIVNVNCNKQ